MTLRVVSELWWNTRHPNYPFTLLTEVFDPCKVQAELPGVEFVSCGVLRDEQPGMRLWGFRFQTDRKKFQELLETKAELLRVDVGPR